MQKFIIKHKKYLMFILVIFVISVLLGFLYYNILNDDVKNNIINTINDSKLINNNYLKDLIIMSTILISSFFIVGIPLSIFYLFYEFFTIGFLFNVFLNVYKVKSLLYILKYIVLNRFIPLIFIIIFIYRIINIGRYVVGLLLYKDVNIKSKIINNFKNSIYIIILFFIINILLFIF